MYWSGWRDFWFRHPCSALTVFELACVGPDKSQITCDLSGPTQAGFASDCTACLVSPFPSLVNNSTNPSSGRPDTLELSNFKQIITYTSYYTPLSLNSKNQLISQCLPNPSAASPSSRSQRRRVKSSSLRNTAPCLKKH